MRLTKFCTSNNSIKRASHLRMGTLFGYRDIEEGELRDEHEGRYEFNINFIDEVRLSNEVINPLLQNTIGFGGNGNAQRLPGHVEATVERLEIVSQTESFTTLKDSSIKISRSTLNCFVYCMSMDLAESPFAQYDDAWHLESYRIPLFLNALGVLIGTNVKLSSFVGDLTSKIAPLTAQRLNVIGRHGPVIYRDRNVNITHDNVPSPGDFYKLISEMAFVKPTKFSTEREYRFLFELNDGEHIYPPINRFELIPLNQLAAFV